MLSSTNPKMGQDFEKILVDYVVGLEGISRMKFNKLNKKS